MQGNWSTHLKYMDVLTLCTDQSAVFNSRKKKLVIPIIYLQT